MPAACRMASKTPPFLLMSLETEAPKCELARIKACVGIEVGGQEGLLGGVLGVSTGTGPGSEAFRAKGKSWEFNFTETPTLIKKSVGGSGGITAPGKGSFGEP